MITSNELRSDMRNRIAALETENAKLRKDAERYRWVRRFPVKTHRLLDIGARKEQLDTAIDAAMVDDLQEHLK